MTTRPRHDQALDDWIAATWPDATDRPEGPARAWLDDVYRREGSLGSDLVEMILLLDMITMAEELFQVVLADIHRTSPERPVITVDDYSDVVRVTVNGNSHTPSMSAPPWERAQALVEIADNIQDEFVGNYGPVWPVCTDHDRGLHAELIDGEAVWTCSAHRKPVARIGELGLGRQASR